LHILLEMKNEKWTIMNQFAYFLGETLTRPFVLLERMI
jgi:hypothetical protein